MAADDMLAGDQAKRPGCLPLWVCASLAAGVAAWVAILLLALQVLGR